MTPDSFAKALDQLDPGSRALLDLSLHRGLDDGEIADLLGADREYVSSSRDAAIEQLADDLGMHGSAEVVLEALGEMPEEAWRPQADGETTEQQDGEAVVEDAAADNGSGTLPHVTVERGAARRRRPGPLLALAGLVVLGVVLAIVLSSGGGGSSSTKSQPASRAPAPSPAPAPKGGATVALQPLAASSAAKGRAALDGRRLTLTVSGLPKPAGVYEVWLYNNEIDAVPVTTFRSGSATVRAKLPAKPAGYRYLDVSMEPADGNPNHSGQSLLRAPLRSLR